MNLTRLRWRRVLSNWKLTVPPWEPVRGRSRSVSESPANWSESWNLPASGTMLARPNRGFNGGLIPGLGRPRSSPSPARRDIVGPLRARRRDGPSGGRHEDLSARLVRHWMGMRDHDLNPLLADLLIHLIISHHGSGRPLVPPAADDTSWAGCRHHWRPGRRGLRQPRKYRLGTAVQIPAVTR